MHRRKDLVASSIRRTALGLALAGLGLGGVLVVPQTAEATFGYYGYGYGTQSKGMGGAGTALAQDPLAGMTNPASLVHLGDVWAVGATLFNPNRSYTADDNFESPPFAFITPGRIKSGSEWFLIPNFARNWVLDEDSSLTLSLAGNGGMNTDYKTAVFENFAPPDAPEQFQASSPTGIDLVQLAIGLSYSRRLNEHHSFGVTPILAVQGFKATGLEPFRPVSIHPDKVTNNGRDYSYGAGVRIGWLGQITDELSLGASYQSKLKMSRFDKYRGLFAEEGKFDIAGTWNVGLAYKVTPDVTVAFDVQRYLYSDVKSINNPNDLPIAPGALGGSDGVGFGWKDITAYKLGAQWRVDPDLTLRAGMAYGDQPVPDTQALFNILAPGVTRRHYTVGLSYRLDDRSEISGLFMHAPKERVSGTNPNTGPQTGFIQMDQNEFELTYTRYLR
ncbi:putative facilitator of salicylate uptake [Thioalkalivibrio nitratireducens DSM 14787]|uniref:Facilitator of salicylate uptake n=1 Tax=Thioalkalivibrio nitratireducens (strain DSM 14787 / UNIQEM 213 / ALEN2) TaxID=1255043 RepID=L0DV04_THIND|nr:putative facilitator of salicylate uptake [Thioalkalivibrio nitratireducens DSM 14787]